MKLEARHCYNSSHRLFTVYLKVYPVQSAIGICVLRHDFWVTLVKSNFDKLWTPRTFQL